MGWGEELVKKRKGGKEEEKKGTVSGFPKGDKTRFP